MSKYFTSISPKRKFKRLRRGADSRKSNSPSPIRSRSKSKSPSPKKIYKLSLKLEDEVVNFFGKKKDFRSLSNFWINDVVVNNIIYESGEHAFHGEKYRTIAEMCNNLDRQKKLLEYSLKFRNPSNKNPNQIKKMGGKTGFKLNNDELNFWTEKSVEIQKKISLWKFRNYEEVRNDLKKSESKMLIHPAMRCSEEKVKDRLWEGKGIIEDGKIKVLGQNKLGKIWMKIRSKYILNK